MNLDKAREPLHARDSNLSASSFSNVSLQGAAFDNVNLQGAAFRNINLSGATVHDANLSNLHITSANTRGMTVNGVAIHDFVHAACDTGGFTAVMPVLKVEDLQRSIDWYCGVIGMKLAWRQPMDGGGENCTLRHGTVTLMLSTGSHLGGRPAFTGTLYLNLADVAALYERIKDKAQIAWPLEAMSYGTTEFGVRDPDGYVLAFATAA